MQDNQKFIYTIFDGNVLQGIMVPNSPFRKLYGLDWTFYSKIFIPNNNTAITFYLGGTIDELYLDDLQIKKNL